MPFGGNYFQGLFQIISFSNHKQRRIEQLENYKQLEVLKRKLKVKNDMWRITEKNQRQISNWVGLLQDFLSVVY